MHEDQEYTLGSVRIYLSSITKVVQWLRARSIRRLGQLTLQQLKDAHSYYCPRHKGISAAVGVLERFLCVQGSVPQGQAPPPSPMAVEVADFAAYLHDTHGLAQKTIAGHCVRLHAFLKFLHFERSPSVLRQLQLRHLDAFLCQSARTHDRSSLQHVAATLRAFLKWRHAQGRLARPLHLQIETPRVYRGERLPRALPRSQVESLLRSIDQSEAGGRRDFALLYLAAAYGLRSGELIRLTLDDIDWQGRTLRVLQTKTRQVLQLPLTDEAANVLIRYLRLGRAQSAHRQLLLRMLAPRGPLQSNAVGAVIAHRIRDSGLDVPPCGTNVLRHSLAMRLVQQGVTVKAIGDVLGHRDITSTAVYVRLDVDHLREVALPVPAIDPGKPVPLISFSSLPRLRPARPSRQLPEDFHSPFARSLQRYVDLKRALGHSCRFERIVLGYWDDFVHRTYPQAQRVRAEMFSGWTAELAALSPTASHVYQRTVRSFLVFHARDHRHTFIPDPVSFPKPAPPVSPRLISAGEMGRVLEAARQLVPTPANPLRAQSFRLGLILLFCCGLRRGELLRLRLGDLENGQTVLRVRLTKFHKSRLVPLSPSVTDELKRYLQERRRSPLLMNPEAFLLGKGSEACGATTLTSIWHRLCVSAQVLRSQGHPPRLHDLRFSFAVNALQRWYAQGADVQSKLFHLATYMGHVNPGSTHYYLKLTPELRRAASERFHRQLAPAFSMGGRA
jgi:integrase/recombinase XerD